MAASLRCKATPLAFAVLDAAETIGISPAKLEEIIKRGDIAPRWIDGKRVITADELHAYLAALPFDKPQ
jgi:hypothetical protein